ncbi:MAG TPA: hypothetical protein VJJ83_02960 [Candidatus Babeliales bacterium]|nr:hypothetical protein [Candidatus Babeliales bacterium]
MSTIYQVYSIAILVSLISHTAVGADGSGAVGSAPSSTAPGLAAIHDQFSVAHRMLARSASLNSAALQALDTAATCKSDAKAQAEIDQAQIKLAAAASLASSALERLHSLPPVVDSARVAVAKHAEDVVIYEPASEWALQSALKYAKSKEIRRAMSWTKSNYMMASARRHAQAYCRGVVGRPMAATPEDSPIFFETNQVLTRNIEHAHAMCIDRATSESVTQAELLAHVENLAAATTAGVVVSAAYSTLRKLKLNLDHSNPWLLAAAKSLEVESRLRMKA